MNQPMSLGRLLRLKVFDDAIKLLNQLDYKYPSMHEASDEFITNKNIELQIQTYFNIEEIYRAYLAYKKCHVAGQITIEERDEIIKELRSQIQIKM